MQIDNIGWPRLMLKGLMKTAEAAMFLANICLAGMLVLVFLNVLLRYILRQPIYWGDEVMTYLMMLIAFLGFGYNLMEGRHIKMTALVERLSVRSENIVSIITSLLAVGYFAFLMVAGIHVTIDSFRIGYFSTITNLPIWPWQLLMCIGLATLLMVSIGYTINKLSIALSNKEKDQN